MSAAKELARIQIEAAHEQTAKKMGWTSRQVLEAMGRIVTDSEHATAKDLQATALFSHYMKISTQFIQSGQAHDILRLAE